VRIKRKWLKVFALLMMGVAPGVGAVNPKEISEMIHIMNERKIEFSIPDDGDDGDGDGEGWWREIDSVEKTILHEDVDGYS
jgi:hypothetical protein